MGRIRVREIDARRYFDIQFRTDFPNFRNYPMQHSADIVILKFLCI
jgi:hypothetical protein